MSRTEAMTAKPLPQSFTLFTVVWAIAHLFHQAQFHLFDNKFYTFLLAVSAILVLARPGRIFRFLCMILLQVNEAFILLPEISNHWIFVTFVNLTIIQSYFVTAYRQKSFQVNSQQFFNQFAAPVRIELLILYFYVVLHKLNSDFFSQDFSCATEFLRRQNIAALTSPFLLALSTYSAVIIEALIPILLSFRATRNAGLLLGLIFHFFIAYNPISGFYDFSSTLFGAYFLFTSPDFHQFVFDKWLRLRTRIVQLSSWDLPVTLIRVFVLIGFLVAVLIVIDFLSYSLRDFFRYILWTVYGITYISVFITYLLSRRSRATTTSLFKTVHWSLYLIPIMVFINGLSPYLGLKTEYSFAMFSNLRTEGRKSNHYIIPPSMQVFGFQNELVEIISSSDPKLQALASEEKLVVHFEFLQMVRQRKPEQLVFKYKGVEYHYDKNNVSAADDILRKKSSFLLSKFLDFRPISKSEHQPCAH